MGFLKNVKAAMAQGMSGAGPTPEQLATLTPEQRAAYDAQMAQVAQAQAEAAQTSTGWAADEMASRPLLGPAGEFLYGRDPRAIQHETTQALETGGVMSYMKASWKATSPKAVAPPEPVALHQNSGLQANHEWTQREQARAPYLAAERFPVVFTRIPTRAGSQLDEVAAHLAASGLAGRPELVFGVYPVPDHIGNDLGRKKSRYVEWDVVHAASQALDPAAVPGATTLPAAATWVARASGEPSVLDEDLGITLLQAAGLGPESCCGVTRLLRTFSESGGDSESGGESYTWIQVLGTQIFGPPGLGDDARAQLAAAAPLALPTGAPPGVHVDVLNWRAVAQAIHPHSQKPRPVPSPFPYLPATPQELIKAYLDVVGLNPFDTYTACVTEDGVRDLLTHGAHFSTTRRTQAPCADGKDRGRIYGGSRVVVAYRDRPSYAEGRDRWQAYEREVLLADLHQRTETRRPVQGLEFGSVNSVARRVLNVALSIADSLDFDSSSTTRVEKIPPHRYCWPPTDVR